MNYDRRALKENAKAAMRQANPKTWLVTLVLLLLVGTVSGTVNALVPNPLGELLAGVMEAIMEKGNFDALAANYYRRQIISTVGVLGVGAVGATAVVSLGATVVVTLLRAVMSYGYYGYALEVYRREPYAGVGSLFKGFPRFGGAVGGTLLVAVFSLLWALLIYGVDISITVLVLFFTDGGRVGTWIGLGVLFLAAAVIHSLIVYRYCLVPYFIMDNKKMPVTQAITASTQAMKGNIFKCFVLRLSFLGWELLRGLIAAAMVVLASVVFVLVAGGSLGLLVDLTEQGSLSMSYDARLVTGIMILIAVVIAVFGLALLAQMPLKLWLTAYENVAFAGFYHELVGGKAMEEPAVAAAPISGSLYFSNTQPTAPAMPEEIPAVPPIEPAAPETISTAPYTPFGSSAPAPVPVEEPAVPDIAAQTIELPEAQPWEGLSPAEEPAPVEEPAASEPEPEAQPSETPDEPEN